MKLKSILLIFLLFGLTKSVVAQSDYLKFKPYKPYTWMIGVGWSFVDNDGRSHSHFLDLKGAWLMHPYPSHILVDRYLKHGYSLELSASYNQINGRKMVNEAYPTGMMFSADFTSRYSFYKFLQPTKWFDPYLGIGVGFSSVNTGSTASYFTGNGVVGMNFWIKQFGIRLQGTIKFGLVSSIYYNNTNYLHYTATLLYKFKPKSKKDNSFQQPKHKWATKKPGKYKGRSK
ncbi:MAG: hypothetical protein M9916_08610 [Crocinitomicaceae bacterium]|nr:hypothetical protein [Crocinitomicaceae bacterium]